MQVYHNDLRFRQWISVIRRASRFLPPAGTFCEGPDQLRIEQIPNPQFEIRNPNSAYKTVK